MDNQDKTILIHQVQYINSQDQILEVQYSIIDSLFSLKINLLKLVNRVNHI